jgi:uncharacterized RDD family membrane protein YckC
MINSYYILEDGQQKGPYTYHEVTEFELGGGELILSPLANDWQQASELQEFHRYFASRGIFFPTVSNLANFWWRLLAYGIDYMILIVSFFVAAFGVGIFGALMHWRVDFNSETSATLFQIFAIILFILYNATFEATEIQGSIGKKICRLMVVDVAGERIRFSKALGRNVSKLISWLLCGFGFLQIFWSDYRQGWHDQIAGAYVIRNTY